MGAGIGDADDESTCSGATVEKLDLVAFLEPREWDEISVAIEIGTEIVWVVASAVSDFASEMKTGSGLADTLDDDLDRYAGSGGEIGEFVVIFAFDEFNIELKLFVGKLVLHMS